MIQIARNKIIIPDDKQLSQLGEEFAKTHCVLLRQFIEPALLEYVLSHLARTKFTTKFEMDDENEFGKVLFVPQSEPVLFTFHFLLNNPALFRAIEQFADCKPIGNFFGRIHSSQPASNHHIAWHGDNADTRLLAITVNLGTENYEGGLFQIREKDTEKITCEIGNINAGDAFIFRIAPNLQHRLTAVESGGARTVGVGWFRAEPVWEEFSKDFFQR